MPFKSKAQQRLCFALKARGQAKGWDCEEWAEQTDFSRLPERVGKRGKRRSAAGRQQKQGAFKMEWTELFEKRADGTVALRQQYLFKEAARLAVGSPAREKVPKSQFAYTGKTPKGTKDKSSAKGKYPMPDRAHALAALGFAAMHHGKDSAEYKRVLAKARQLGYVK